MGLFHYTTELRHTSISSQKVLLPSEDTQLDSAYGEGWYLTDLRPGTCVYQLMDTCWQRTTLFQRVKYYLELEVQGASAVWRRDHVYFVRKRPTVSFRLLSSGDSPLCCIDRARCLNRF